MPLPPRFARALESMSVRVCRAFLLAAVALAGVSCVSNPSVGSADGLPVPTSTVAKIGGPVTKLQVIELSPGSGAEAIPGMFVVVHYTGWLYDPAFLDGRGRKFDSTTDRNAAFGFYLGTGRVIQGWDEGVPGMRIGGKRTLLVPSDMAYGAAGVDIVPPFASLVFEIELLDARTSRAVPIQ